MRRRDLLVAAGVVLAGRGRAQPLSGAGRTVGALSFEEREGSNLRTVRERLNEIGRARQQPIRFDPRYAGGNTDRLAALAHELVALRPDAIVTVGIQTTRAAAAATRRIPIVQGPGGDLVAAKLAESYARPGGNVTGFVLLERELDVKRLELLKEAFPELTRVAVLWNPAGAESAALLREHSQRLKLALVEARVAEAGDLSHAVTAALTAGAQALIVLANSTFYSNRATIVRSVADALPAIYPEREYVHDGGLLAYYPLVLDQWRRVADVVVRILDGARPPEIPIEQPTAMAVIVNQRTARALGLSLSSAFLARADEVIE